jgi:two-component sensor histidine kinase
LVFRGKTDGWRTWGSPQWSIFTGLAFDDSLEFRWLDAVHPDDRERTRDAWAEAAASGQYYCEHRFRRASDGEYRWHQTRAVPLGQPGLRDTEWVGTSTDIHTLRSLQERQKVLLAELQHRTRNLLAVVQSIARRTLRSSASLGDFREEYERRLRALGRVQSLLARSDHHSIELRELLELEFHAHGVSQATANVSVHGPPVRLSASAGQVMALAFHELATNAVKYGALGQPAGKLSIAWQADDTAEGQMVRIEWREIDIEIPEGARRKGYGSELIERALPYQLGAKTRLQIGPDDVRCEILISTMKNERSDG